MYVATRSIPLVSVSKSLVKKRNVWRFAALVTPDEPAALDLQPPSATNTVDDEHCLTATVRD